MLKLDLSKLNAFVPNDYILIYHYFMLSLLTTKSKPFTRLRHALTPVPARYRLPAAGWFDIGSGRTLPG